MPLLRLFLIFVKIGAVLLGGGYVILPVLQSEFTEKRHLTTPEELVNYFAISQSMPGIIAANMSMFIGYKLNGKLGAVTAMFGVIFVPFWCIVILASVLSALVNNNLIQGILWGVGIAVIALILLTVREIWQKSKRGLFFYLMFLASLTALLIFRFTPILTVIAFSLLGIAVKIFRRRRSK